MLILGRSSFIVLLDLEEILFVIERLVLLVAQLCVCIAVSIVVDELSYQPRQPSRPPSALNTVIYLVLPLRNSLPDLLDIFT